MNLLVLGNDAFGGRGGIAQFNRDLIGALCRHPRHPTVVALVRQAPEPVVAIPDGAVFQVSRRNSRLNYAANVLLAACRRPFAAVLCQHIHLLPLAQAVAGLQRAPLILTIYGIDAWQRPRNRMLVRALRSVDGIVAISEFTRARFIDWAPVDYAKVHVLPCCVDQERFTAGEKPEALLARYSLRGRKILLTVGRLASTERYKGFDEVLEALPRLAVTLPSISYVIAGDGPDRGRLEAKAVSLGVRDRVVFTGYIAEEEKPVHYRLADAFVLPGRGEGFGIVLLEALACGIPVIASSLDASKETVLNGAIGQIVDPREPGQLEEAIIAALGRDDRIASPELSYFSRDCFAQRWHDLIDRYAQRPSAFDISPIA